MKRLLAALVLLLLLVGCSAGSADPVRVRPLDTLTDFGAFTADAPGDCDAARALVDAALDRYPESLLRQLGHVEILLVSDLTGEERFSHGSYAGFTLRTGSGWQIVLDAEACDAGTVHHEIAHVLDGILTDAGALTEADWLALCPSAFHYGDQNWADYPDFFVDAYAMQNMQEDRARLFEEAMLYGPGAFEGKPALWLKLEYFSRCLRSHFCDEDWPAETPWEAALD